MIRVVEEWFQLIRFRFDFKEFGREEFTGPKLFRPIACTSSKSLTSLFLRVSSHKSNHFGLSLLSDDVAFKNDDFPFIIMIKITIPTEAAQCGSMHCNSFKLQRQKDGNSKRQKG